MRIMQPNTLSTLGRCSLILGAFVLTACYQYVPAELGSPPRGSIVRAEVQGSPMFQVGDRTVREVTRVDGEVIRWEPDTLALSALELRSVDRDYAGSGYTVRLAMADVVSVSLRRLDKPRTTLLVLASIVAGWAAQQSLGGGAKGDDNPPGGGTVH